MSRIAFLTHAGAPEIHVNDRLAAEALIKRGNVVDGVVWDDPSIQWKDYDIIVVRSSWDYHYKYREWMTFLAHLESIDANLWNPAETIRWNADKQYLKDLKHNGILIPKTNWVEAGTSADLAAVMEENAWEQAVVKPNRSATAHQTWLLNRDNVKEVQVHFDKAVAQKPMMIQEFMPEIKEEGEWSFIFINNEYSHSMLKQPAEGDFRVQSDFGGTVVARKPDAYLIEEAEAVLFSVPMKHLYARVDAVISDGALFVMELELIEPQLFLSKENGSVDRFVRALLLK